MEKAHAHHADKDLAEDHYWQSWLFIIVITVATRIADVTCMLTIIFIVCLRVSS